MPLRVHCPNPSCNKSAVVHEDSVGKRVRCRGCSTILTVGGATTTLADGSPLQYTVEAAPTAPGSDPAPAGGDASPPQAAPPQEAGERVGRFIVRAKLGAGAFGTVYRAYDPQLDREVALKVPHAAALASPKRVERFTREARAAAGLRHPNVVPVYDSGQDGGRYFIASAFIAGKPLEDLVEDGGMDFRRAAEIVRKAAEGLAYAHANGVVHRDVKPANVLVEAGDNPQIADFGLATRGEEESRLTADGAVLGTPSYMAPEQAAGQKGEARPAADQYSLGVVLYELLTGRTPFAGPPAVVIHNQIHTRPEPPAKIRKDVPRDLETVCLKAMEKRPEDRYPDCQAMADDLRRWLEGEPITARRLGLIERGVRWVRREPLLAGAVGSILALLAAVGVLLTIQNTELIEQLRLVQLDRDANRDRADGAEKDADAAKKEADAAGGARDEANVVAAAGAGAGGELILAEVPVNRRDLDWGLVAMKVRQAPDYGRLLNRLPGAQGGMSWLTFPGGSGRLLGLGNDRTLTLWNVWTGAAAPVGKLAGKLPAPTPRFQPSETRTVVLSADGKRVVVVEATGGLKDRDGKEPPLTCKVTVLDAESGGEVRTWAVDGFWPAAAVNADGSRVALAYATAGLPHRLGVWDVATGGRVAEMDQEIAPAPMSGVVLVFSPDGTALAASTARDKGEVRAWAVPAGGEVMLIPDAGLVSHLAFSPDGRRLAAVGGAEVVRNTADLTAWSDVVPVERVETRTVKKAVFVTRSVKKTLKDKNGLECIVEYDVSVPEWVDAQEAYKYLTYETRAATRPGPWLAPRVEMMTYTMMKNVTTKQAIPEKVTKTVLRKGKRTANGKTEECECEDVVEETVYKEVPVTTCVPTTATKTLRTADKLLRVWDRPDNALSLRAEEPGAILAIAWRGDGLRIASAFAGASTKTSVCNAPNPITCPADNPTAALVRVRNSRTARILHTLEREGVTDLSCLAWSADGVHLAAGFRDHPQVACWSCDSKELVATRFEHEGPVTDLAFSPDNKFLASFGKCSARVRLWDGGTCAPLRYVGPAFESSQFGGGKYFVTGARRTPGLSVNYWGPPQGVWSRETGAAVRWPDFNLAAAAATPDGVRVLGWNRGAPKPAGKASDLEVRDAHGGDAVSTLAGSADAFGSWTFTPGGKHVLLLDQSKEQRPPGAPPTRTLRVWSAATGKSAFTRDDVVSVWCSAEAGRLAVAATKPKPALLILDPADGTEIGSVALEMNELAGIQDAAFIGKEHLLVYGRGEVRVFDLVTGQSLWRQPCPTGLWSASPDGKFVAILAGGDAAPPPVAGLPVAPPPPLGGVPAPQPPAVAGNASIVLVEAQSGKQVREVKVNARFVAEVAFSPDGKLLAYCGGTGPLRADGLVDVVTVEKGERIASFRGHTQTVNRIAFRPDGKVIASGGADHTVRLWNVPAPDADPIPDDPPEVNPILPGPILAPGNPVPGPAPVIPVPMPPAPKPKDPAPVG